MGQKRGSTKDSGVGVRVTMWTPRPRVLDCRRGGKTHTAPLSPLVNSFLWFHLQFSFCTTDIRTTEYGY